MLQNLKIAAVALLATTGIASAATTIGQLSAAGLYTVDDGTRFNIGDTITIGAPSFSTGTDDYAGIMMGTSSFSLQTAAAPNTLNDGTTFTFGAFTFEIDSTEVSTLDNVAYEIFGLGTVTGGGFDPSPSSYRLTIAGAQQNTSSSGTFSLFVATPPEELPPVPAVPLPAGLPLLMGGIAVFGVLRRRARA
ncbi:hypothetical protein OCGS_1761 [Oceaniovalibus guishaninsula JLT2003]|uniref:Uncharacterized protein n=1 Tax=Oceaniovalibus guishaninsula JLT2003 TaxID=1231392 RepID=K2I5N3_9RHOB|nr:VPLPA-CTERM sorting domain-containing protein [Oceaniovalibus guishaninsula]EKE44245.1 hypothetical protein OCGS_1761 [Oceaniovalibus guishaninsula JLT2003]